MVMVGQWIKRCTEGQTKLFTHETQWRAVQRDKRSQGASKMQQVERDSDDDFDDDNGVDDNERQECHLEVEAVLC